MLASIESTIDACTCVDIDTKIRYKINTTITYVSSLLKILNRIVATWNINKENLLYGSYQNRFANLLNLNIISNSSTNMALQNAYNKLIEFLNNKFDNKVRLFRFEYCSFIFKNNFKYYVFSRVDKNRFVFFNLKSLKQQLFAFNEFSN